MKLVSLMIAATALACAWTGSASAQQAVRPQWNYQGSAVCPNGYDYYAGRGLCMARGGYGGGYARYRGGYGGGVAPRWNSAGSAVCPEGYDYHAHSGYCRPQ